MVAGLQRLVLPHSRALSGCARRPQTEVAELLIERGAAVGVTNKKGKTLREMMNPKMLVALEGKLAAVEAKVEL